MKYPPPHHQEANFKNCIYLAKAFPLATVISSLEGRIYSSHIPLVYQQNKGLGVFVGHLDRFNPQWKTFQEQPPVTLIFHGPETYISPSVYHSTQLPTWNYFKAHFTGIPRLIDNPKKVKESLIAMTEVLEGSEPGYRLAADNPRMEAALPYIIGFEIEVTTWEGKHKISQDKSKKDQSEAQKALENKYPSMLDIIQNLYAQHQTKTRSTDESTSPNP